MVLKNLWLLPLAIFGRSQNNLPQHVFVKCKLWHLFVQGRSDNCLSRAEGENPVLPSRAPASASPTSEPEEQYEEEEQDEQCKFDIINTQRVQV